jgi:hypothetical protein
VDVQSRAGDLSVEQRQFVEIARALSFGTRFIILDEPTAQLDAAAIARLFSHMRDLRRQGVTFLFISHHLQEIYEICDTVTVFRDARHIVTAPVDGLPRGELIGAMTGEASTLQAPRSRKALTRQQEVILSVADLCLPAIRWVSRVGFSWLGRGWVSPGCVAGAGWGLWWWCFWFGVLCLVSGVRDGLVGGVVRAARLTWVRERGVARSHDDLLGVPGFVSWGWAAQSLEAVRTGCCVRAV